MRQPVQPYRTGFTLVELALVLVIAGLLIGSLLPIIALQREQRALHETRDTIAEAMAALLGFAAVNGRLPCPAVAGTTGVEAPEGGGNCTIWEGLLPAATLGVMPVDGQGYGLDAWGGRLRYAVSDASTSHPGCAGGQKTGVFTTANCMRAVTMPVLSPNLSVCSSACATTLVTQIPAVIYSTGRNFAIGGTGKDERENPNPNTDGTNPDPTPRRFVSHDPTPAESPNGEFDDFVVWLSPNILYSRMIVAGRLP
jgi:prepilin-type N-terminal cleavage/methylation domain-containing protein